MKCEAKAQILVSIFAATILLSPFASFAQELDVLPKGPRGKDYAFAVVPVTVNMQVGSVKTQSEMLIEAMRHFQLKAQDLKTTQELFHKHGSQEPAPIRQSDIEFLEKCNSETFQMAIEADIQKQVKKTEECLARAKASLETLNRHQRAHKNIFDICMYLVRTLGHEKQVEEARALTTECYILSPNSRPIEGVHPPGTRELFREIKERNESEQNSSLRIGTSHGQKGCRVYLNGNDMGQTPFLRNGGPYGPLKAQVECPNLKRARVYVINSLPGAQMDYRFDTRMDNALRTQEQVELIYPSKQERDSYAPSDAASIGKTINATEIWTLTMMPPFEARIDRIRIGRNGVVASAWLDLDSQSRLSQETLNAVVPLLAQGKSVDVRHGQLSTSKAWQPKEPPDSDTQRPWQNPLFWTLVAVGAAGIGVAAYGFIAGEQCDERGMVTNRCLVGKEPNTPALLVYAGVGVAALAGATYWFLSDRTSDESPSRHANFGFDLGPTGLALAARF